MFGQKATSGIKKLELIEAPYKSVLAICHIDDDSFFHFDEIVIGEMAGKSTQAIKAECDSIAKSVFGNSSSSGLKFY